MDNTYKTNRFGLHLFQATGVTDQKSLANFAFGLINGEKEHHFQWLCDRLDELRIEIGADPPEVIITDKEQALRTSPHEHLSRCPTAAMRVPHLGQRPS